MIVISLSNTRSGRAVGDPFAYDWLKCTLTGHDYRAVLLKDLASADVISINMGIDHIPYPYVEAVQLNRIVLVLAGEAKFRLRE